MMFISKFNAMIRNKLIWGGIAFFVVLAFVMWDTRTDRGRAEADAGIAGMLDGEPVERNEFRHAYFNTYLSMCLSMGRRLNVDTEMDAVLNRMAWKRLASLRKAETMGLTVASDEVVAAIREQPFFLADGRFSPERYGSFVRGFLADLGASEQQFEEFMRQETALSKLRYAIAQSAWAPPSDIAQVFHQLYDEFTVQYAALMRDELDHMVTVTEEDGRALFSRDPGRFMIPEKVSVKYVEFPIKDFIDEASVSDELLQRHYDEYINNLIESGKDEWESVPRLQEVEEEVRRAAALREAEERANERAFTFEIMLAPDRTGHAPAFNEAASVMGLSVSTSALFAVDEELEDPDAGLDFNEAAFALRPTLEECFSYPVRGRDSFIVLGYHERVDARVPEFEEVRERVMDEAAEHALTEKLNELAHDIREAMIEDTGAGISFDESAASFGLEVFDFGPFTVTSALSEFDDTEKSYMLLTYALSCNAGELTDVIPLEDGLLIGYVAEREPASRTTYEAIRNELLEYIRQRRQETVFRSWQAHLLESAGFEDFTALRHPPPDDADLDYN